MPKIKQIKIGSTTYDLSIPLATASDNNKVLTVVNGEWAAAAVPTELPSVTASDNGKVLAVSSGSWAAVTPSSGGGGSGSSEVVYITMEDDGTMTYNGNSIDSSDIISLYDSGKDVRAKWYIDPQDDDIYYILYLNYVDHSQLEIVEFKGIGKISGVLKTIVAWASVDDSDIANLEFYQLETINSYNASCYAAAGTASKVISLSSNIPFDLQTGAQIAVKFTYGNTVTNPVIVIGTTAKQILYHGGNLTSTTIKANDTVLLQYNGSSFDIIAIDRQAAAELPDFTTADEGKVLGIVDGAWALKEDATGGGGGGGGGTSSTLLGTTPLKLAADADNLILSGSGEFSYTLQSDTVADFPVLSGTTNNVTVTQENGVFVLTCGSGASAWYQAYVDITISGLVVNQSYNFVFDAAGCDYNETTHRTVGHYILYDGSGNTLVTRGATDTNKLSSYAFTAPTTSVRVRWYPATNNTFSSGVSVATVNAIYINRAGTTEHTAILDVSGTFTDSTTIPGVPSGTTVSSTPSCSVYSKASESGGAALPLEGKTVVCFGDSLFGMYRGSTSAPAYVAKVTGATVYNVGFGGCRMSDHPSHGYAEFSMWALAHAIATDTWTDQDTYASQGSDYFPEQLTTLKGIDFSTVDYAVIHYGTNDFGGGVAIGADSAATVHNTLCGALRYSIETLLTAYPKLRIFVSLPCFRFWTVNGQTVYSDTYTNSQNKTLVEYVAALRSVAGEYNIPVIENYRGNGINKVNASTFLSDGTHHNTDGRERFGTYIAENLISGGSSGIAAAENNSFGGGA